MTKENHICSDFFANKVKCEECKHWIDKYDASKVTHYGIYGEIIEWYCPRDKKPYDSYIIAIPNNLYYGQVSMEVDGTPKGYKKVEHKAREN